MADEYSLSDVLERIYQNQLGSEAALMELTLHVKQQGFTEVEVGDNVRGALSAIGENAGHIKRTGQAEGEEWELASVIAVPNEHYSAAFGLNSIWCLQRPRVTSHANPVRET